MKKLNLFLFVLVGFILCALTADAASIPKMPWPINSKSINLSWGAPWSYKTHCTDISWYHTGIDIKASVGTKVYASESGTVKISQSSNSDWKEWITIEHKDSKGNKYTTCYWHLQKRKFAVGSTVKKGQQIAEVADMGRNTHFHFGIRNAGYTNTSNNGGLPKTACTGYPAFYESFVNPLNYLQ
jgi:murein DD-endopeptidase MepM/ murein hydrolase activator NlpD